ncbi:MAG: DUF4013 domain-containing protein [candidate division Zixibacteria bacterium]|nr:DUF4013 domain-containing protein [candidate division Zixibacteria bacterium]
MLDVGKAFSLLFADKRWLEKWLLGALLHIAAVLIIGIPFLLGYLLEVTRRALKEETFELPEWQEWGIFFGQGLIYFIILLVYLLPVIFFSVISGCLTMPYLLLFYFIFPVLTFRFAQTGDFASAFRFNEMIAFIQNNLANLVVVWFVGLLATVVASFGVLAFFIGLCFSAFWAEVAMFYLAGSLVRVAPKSATSESTPPTSAA